jgi:Polysaccharide deacetylase
MRLGTQREKECAIREIVKSLRFLPVHTRNAFIDTLIEKSGRAEVIRRLSRSMMLEWSQVRLMHSAGVEIGAHSTTHPVLSHVQLGAAREEVVGSVRRVTEMVGTETCTFAYPYGSKDDVDPRVVEICATSGIRAAVMLVDGAAPGDDPFRIPRTMVTQDRSTSPWGSFSRAMWACEMEGLVDLVRDLAAGIRGVFRKVLLVVFAMTRVVEGHCYGDVTSYPL